jgi:hypothetical protein
LHLVGEATVFERIYEFGVLVESACEVRDSVVEVAFPELGHSSIVVGGRNIGSFTWMLNKLRASRDGCVRVNGRAIT